MTTFTRWLVAGIMFAGVAPHAEPVMQVGEKVGLAFQPDGNADSNFRTDGPANSLTAVDCLPNLLAGDLRRTLCRTLLTGWKA